MCELPIFFEYTLFALICAEIILIAFLLVYLIFEKVLDFNMDI